MALLVTVGGLRLLAAAEAPRRIRVPRAAAPATAVALQRAREPAAYEVTAADFLATVERTARFVECAPAACGYPRTRMTEDAAPPWRIAPESVTIRWADDLAPGAHGLPVSWVPGGTCGLGCPERMRSPDALFARF